MAKVLLGVGVLLFIVGTVFFLRGPTEDPLSFLWWGIPFIVGTVIVAVGLRRAATRALRVLSAVLLVPYLAAVGFFAVVLVFRLT